MIIQKTISKLTTDVWENIELSKNLKINYGEETISDTILLELAKLRSYNLTIIQTPKNIEKTQGTDWEWFIGSQTNGWIRYAIQAKKINPNTKNGDYSCLNHIVGLDRQIDILKKYSEDNKAIPLYSFYNHYPKANKNDHWQCKKNFELKLLGWTITTIKNVQESLKTRGSRNFDNLHKKKETLPIRCLFECPILLLQYQDPSLIGKKIKIFDTNYKKIESLPWDISNKEGIMTIKRFPEELYNNKIELYPKRIAIFNIKN